MKLSKKNLGLLFSCFACSAFLTAAGASSAFADEKVPSLSDPLCISGTIHKENGRLFMTDIHGGTTLDQLVLNTSDETRILDAVNGFPVSAEDLQEGESVCAYISHAMTLSLPPQSHAYMIICQIPADFAAPAYETADSLIWNADGTATLKTAGGNDYVLNSSTTLLPYLTRNIVTYDDLTKGRTCLIWSTAGEGELSGQRTASKIVLFADGQTSQVTGPASDPALLSKTLN